MTYKRLQRVVFIAGIVASSTLSLSLFAEEVFVTSFVGPAPYSDLTPCPHSCLTGFSEFGATVPSTIQPHPIPAATRRVSYALTNGASWSVTPMDAIYTPETGGTFAFTSLHYKKSFYKIFVTKGQSTSTSSDVIVSMTATGGGLADIHGVGSTAVEIDAFQASKPNNVWIQVGYITNDIANPTLTFTHTGGTVGFLSRWYADTVRFSSADPLWIQLQYRVTGDQLTFAWIGNCTLQAKSALGEGSWSDVTATSGYQVSLSSSASNFYRLRLNN